MPPELSRPDETLAEWLARRRWKYDKFQKMKRLGLTPEVLRPPHTNRVTITPAADAAWERRMQELAKSDEGRLEEQRRSEQRRMAVRVALARGTLDPGGRRHAARKSSRDLLPPLHATEGTQTTQRLRPPSR